MLSCRYHKLSTSSGRGVGCIPARTGRQATGRFPPRLLAALCLAASRRRRCLTYAVLVGVEEHQ